MTVWIRDDYGVYKLLKSGSELIVSFDGQPLSDKASFQRVQNANNFSENVIDVLKVGDYVNGRIITSISKQNNCVHTNEGIILGKDIHTVIAKETLEMLVYKEKSK